MLISKSRESYLIGQLKGIKKKLGMESDGKDKLIGKFDERVKTVKMLEYTVMSTYARTLLDHAA